MNELPEQMTQCNCSICRRLAARWIFYKKAEVTITNPQQKMQTYQWGDKMLDFYRCRNCGCTTHYVANKASGIDRVGINVNMMDPHVIEGINIRLFNGADM